MTPAEGVFLAVLQHIRQNIQTYLLSVDHVEAMLRKQLAQAIGKEVTAKDFTEYMRYNDRLLFKREFQPRPFSYAVRLPDHYPEGIVSIHCNNDDGSVSDPLLTNVRHVDCPAPF